MNQQDEIVDQRVFMVAISAYNQVVESFNQKLRDAGYNTDYRGLQTETSA